MNRNSEIESDGRVWRRCWPISALSMACTLVLPELASEIPLVINF
jgi:hypothetical protein